MILLKYTGDKDISVLINGNKKLLKPGAMFSGPVSLSSSDGFEKIGGGNSKATKEPVKVEVVVSDYYEQDVDLDFLDENSLPKVSICIPTKDNYDVIKRCLLSIVEKVDYRGDVEVLVCDTGTTDSKVLDLYKELYTKYGDMFKFFMDHEYNFSKNNNFLADKSTGDVLLFMNNDVFLTYDAISEMVKYINCSNIGCLGHRLVWSEEPDLIQHDGQIICHPDGT